LLPHEGENGGARMGNAMFGTRIGYCCDAVNEKGKGVGSNCGLGYVDHREGEKGNV